MQITNLFSFDYHFLFNGANRSSNTHVTPITKQTDNQEGIGKVIRIPKLKS